MVLLHRETSMREDCATSMSASHGCNDDTEVVRSLKEALKQRVGADRYQMWFSQGVDFSIDSQNCADANGINRSTVFLRVRGQFALDRLRKNFLREIRGAAMQASGSSMDVEFCLDEPPAEQAELPLGEARDDAETTETTGAPGPSSVNQHDRDQQAGNSAARRFKQSSPKQKRSRSGRGKTKSLSTLIAGSAGARGGTAKSESRSSSPGGQLELPNLGSDSKLPASAKPAATPGRLGSRSSMTTANFVSGSSNQLAHTAMTMVCQNPAAASPLFLSGPTGTGKTHILSAIADQLRRRHRMRRVMHLSAEQFTNDFISSVGNSGITAFRRRYRDVDALLIDDVQFLGSKKATLREMLYTVETLAGAGRPLIFSGLQAPTEIQGLSRELAGRMAAGLVCPIQPLDGTTREVILRRWTAERCQIPVPDCIIGQINPILAGDGRVISGIVNLLNTLQRMHGRMPTMDELRRFGGELLRAGKPIATLSVIELAVCQTFHLQPDTLSGGSQTRAVTEPRMLAMYLSRQLTSSAYAEIAGHFGGKSHSTAIAAEKNVKLWLENGRAIGRGHVAISVQEAIDRVECLLRHG
jgi:chromosomal replication initiator protein